MSKFVSRAIVMRSGARVPNVKNVKLDPVTHRQAVLTMDGPGTVEVGHGFGFSFDEVVPKTNMKTDWGDVEGENFSIELNGGQRIEFINCDCLSEGEMTLDFEKETVRTITFHAEARSFR